MSGMVRLEKPEAENGRDYSLTEIVSVRLSVTDVANLNALVRAEQREASVLIRMAIRAYIRERLERVA